MTIELPDSVRSYFDALNSIDRSAFVSCFAADATVRDPYGGPELRGQDGLNKFFDGMERTWREFNMEPQAAYKGGARVAVPWATTAVAKNGKGVQFSGVNVFTIGDDERIQELNAYWDFKAMLAQIRE